MFYLNKETPLDAALLQKMINKFHLEDEPRLSKYKNYYDGKQAILNKKYKDPSKPCNKTVINYCKNITDSYAGYMAAPGHISYSSEQDIEDIMNILRYNDYQTEDANLLVDALVYGRANELMYHDSFGKTRFRLIDSRQCFGVYDDTLTGDLMYFVRFYKANAWDDSDTYHIDVYSDFDIKHYTMAGTNGNPTFVGEEPHYFSQCPANIFYLPGEKSIFDCVIDLQDSFNTLFSGEIDDFAAFCDAYLVAIGADLDPDTMAESKEVRGFNLPVGADLKWLTKNINDTQIENMLKRAHDSIYRIAACPDFSSESFVGGVSSGIAIQYRLTGMETRASVIEGEMKKALQRRIEIICGIASLKLGEEVFRDIQISFKRNVPADTQSVINLVNALKGTVSTKTLLEQLDFIADVNSEIEALNEEKQANISLYNFGSSFEENLDEND